MPVTTAHCNTCDGDRNHAILHRETISWREDESLVTGEEVFETLKCLGCDGVKLRSVSWNSENGHGKVFYFPPAKFRRQPRWMLMLCLELAPENIFVEELLQEIYVAFYQGLLRLAAMGVRSLIEKIMISETGDHGSFNKNISAFERLGYVSNVQKTRLEAILEVGHATTHRTYSPTTDDIHTLLDVTEHIIEAVYVHGDKVAELKKNTPPRPQRSDI